MQTLPEAYNSAIEHQEKGNLEEAEQIYRLILQQDLDYAEANKLYAEVYTRLGRIYFQQEKLEEALTACRQAIQNDPDLAETYATLGDILAAKEEIPAAVRSYEKAIAIQPDFAQVNFNLGDLLTRQGQKDAATKSYYAAAIATYPNLAVDLHFNSTLTYGHNIMWDPWLLQDGDVYHLCYLTGQRHVQPFWKQGEVSSASSRDLKNWQYQGNILKPGSNHYWQADNICAGSLYKDNDTYYLFYSTSIYKEDGVEQTVGLASSADGVNWNFRPTPLLKPEPRWYGSSTRPGCEPSDPLNNIIQFRDPYVVKDPETGKYYMYITAVAARNVATSLSYKGCIGLAVADKIDGPYQCLPPAAETLLEGTEESIYYELERPQVIFQNGRYYLFFSSWARWVNRKWVERVGRDGISDSSIYCYVSDRIAGPFKPLNEKPIVKGSDRTGLYGTQFIANPQKNGWLAYGWNYKSKTLEVSDRFPVIWEGDRIEILI